MFEFDYDLTLMMFFMDAEEKVYSRYGGRDARNADNRQSLAGLRSTMQSVLAMHARDQEEREFAPKAQATAKFIKSEVGFKGGGRCMHCHQVKEIYMGRAKKEGVWNRDAIWRYPLPENVGFTLDVDKSNVVKAVQPESPASNAGLRVGDVVQRMGAVPVHSFADAQFALDKAAATGALTIAWKRGGEEQSGELTLAEGWRKTDVSWRASLRFLIPSVRLSGDDLSAAEKQALGLGPKQLAFRQSTVVSNQAKTAGIRAGDIIFGLDDRMLLMDSFELIRYVHRQYFAGDTVVVNLIRDGKRLNLEMKLGR